MSSVIVRPRCLFSYLSGVFSVCHLRVLIFLMVASCAQTQLLRPFPPLFNAALNRPISTNPSASTCGVSARNAYCISSTSVDSINRCIQGYCFQGCSDRSGPPPDSSIFNFLTATSPGSGDCVLADTVNVRPGSASGQYSTVIVRTGPTCYLSPVQSPRIDTSGVVAFTVSSWIWLDSQTKGTLLEKRATNGGVLFSLQVGVTGFTFIYGKVSENVLSVSIDATIKFQQWTHIALQVHDVRVSAYINGPGPDLAAAATVQLLDSVTDGDGSFVVGQNLNGSAQFVGRIQDLKFYTLTLTNREIAAVYSGIFPSVRIQSECRCPGTYPRIKPGQTVYCIKNGDVATANDMTLRILRDAHPLEYANDGDSTSMWISDFHQEVEIEIDLGDQFQVFYVVLQFYSPLPKAVTIFRQINSSSPFQVWQYYADDCRDRFGLENNGALTMPDSINCLQFGTNGLPIPYSLGNITFSLLALNPVARPGSTDFYNTPELNAFVGAQKVRVVFTEHYYTTNIRHQYYALYEFIVTAWCDCNGHASQCNTSSLPYTCTCMDTSNTEGARCERCKPLFNNKPYRKGNNIQDFPCQPCTCNGHASSCVYNATLDLFPESPDQGGGGVCINCLHYTTGRFCDTCIPNYFRPSGVSLYDPAVCQLCNCSTAGVAAGGSMDCSKVGGQCTCKTNVEGRRCDVCKVGFYGLSSANADGCLLCNCNVLGTVGGSVVCDQTTGQCLCKANVRGLRCDECAYGSYGLSGDNALGCSPCNCNPVGSISVYCAPSTGQCQCKDRVQGLRCDVCMDGFYNFASGCVPCTCNVQGSAGGTVCDKTSGQCTCKPNVGGTNCDQCQDGTYGFGSSTLLGCQMCPCYIAGTVNGTGLCDKTSGLCLCKANVEGQGCNVCKANTWGLNVTNPVGCQSCDCDPLGTLLENRTVCDQNTGQCPCLSNRQGRRCDSCAAGTYINIYGGCLPCSCNALGTLSGTFCNSITGQCECKQGDFGVAGKNCDQCMPTFYAFNPRLGSCSPCNCLLAGSLNTTCHSVTGQCQCKMFVTGRACDRCAAGSSQMDANNPYGCSTAPSQQPPPQSINRTSTSITLVWGAPDSPNGVLQGYNIYRNSTLVNRNPASVQTYQDSNLQPFTYYSYEIEVQNGFGSVRSTAVVFQTLAGMPSNDFILTVTDIRARSASCSWTPPSNLNGALLKYVIQSLKGTSNITVLEWEGTTLSTTITTLSPYSRYTLTALACTVGGCAASAGVNITTLSAPPENQQPPVVTPISSSQLLVSWSLPLQPNGIISFYELWQRGSLGPDGQYHPPASIIFHPSGRYDPLVPPAGSPLNPPATSFNVTGLMPFTTYGFQVLSENDAGKAASDWVEGRTLEAAPVSIASPSVIGLSSSQLLVSWSTPPPSDMQGLVSIYRLFQNFPQNVIMDPFGPPYTWNLIYEGDGTVLNTTVSGLTPYSEHSFILEACNTMGCVNSTAISGRTLIAAPEGVQKPTATGYNTTTMQIQWNSPLFPNGPSPIYKVEKTNIALSYPASVVRGIRFTGGGYYAFPPSVFPQNVAFSGIRFRFKLDRGTGILLFTATNTQEEFLAIQFVNGRPRFMFDTQGCQNIASVTTTNDEGRVYNDRNWHFLVARRTGGYGNITVDDKWTGESSIRDAICLNTTIIGPTTAVYVGGFPPDFVLRRTDRTRRVETTPLQGCIDAVEILQQVSPEEVWTPLNWTQGMTSHLEFLNWQGCPINLEPGFHFMGKGYLVISNCEDNICSVSGNKINVQFSMRTEMHTGFLFMLYGGNNIYMYSVLESGKLKFVISSNAARTVVTYDDPNVNFCDGKWRLVNFSKIGQQAMISGPQLQTFAVGDPNVDMSLALVSDIFLGGFKRDSAARKYVQDNNLTVPEEGFGGCFSGFQINDKLYDKDMIVVEVANTNLDGCPPYYNSTNMCQSDLITQVYNGTDMIAYDTGLLPYTDNIYRVVALNLAGEGVSSWAYGRTREGAPTGVKGPSSVRAISGTEIEVIWEEPTTTYGLLTKFIVKAYHVQGNGTFESMDVTDVSVTAVNMTSMTPDTVYFVKIVACTPGGCTESDDGKNVTTDIEAPEDVPAPTADAGPTFLFVKWQAPGKPNGPITGYILTQNGNQVYRGGQLSYNITGLQVYTAYNFYVSACTVAGCTNGPTVDLSTSQLPPASVGQPTLLVLDTSRIKVTWQAPSATNGRLESYLLYVSTIEGNLGQPVYNSTVLATDTILDGLLAGTLYYITLGACTGGGCTLGSPANATTQESSPNGVPMPVVTSPSPSSFVVTWGPPEFPNGIITHYDLIQNKVVVYTGPNQNLTINNLQPYSRHLFQVRACTVQGCALSDEVEARTLESPPEGVIVLNVTVIDARNVSVIWSMPENLNGNMTFTVYFTGLFYANPGAWNYTTITDRRQLLVSSSGYKLYQVMSLVPMSNYSVQVNGSTSAGYILSNIVQANMPPSSPDGMAPPDLISETPTSMKVTWKPVGRVNAPEIVAYRLQFLDSTPNAVIQDEFGPTVALTYTKVNLLPSAQYSFRVIASNSFGQTQSPWASLVTKQGKPAAMNLPSLVGVNARYVDITWSAPLSPNGIITQYNVYVNGTLRANTPGNVTSMRVDNLTPFTFYTFNIEACTLGGCTMSLPTVPVRTLQALPEDLSAPVLTAMSPSAVRINYKEPGKANGIISLYTIERKDGSSPNVTVVASRVAEMDKTYIDESNSLTPFSVYNYRVNVQNGAGTAIGLFAQVTTGSSVPAGINPPQVISVNATSVLCKWSQPIQANGPVEMYVLRFPDPRIEVRDTTVLSKVVTGLTPFTQYSVTVTACTSAGCTESVPTYFTTDPSIPSGQAAPVPTVISQSRISVLWQPPGSPNGPNISYELSRVKVRQPLDTTAGDIGQWQSIFLGTNTFYEDFGLPMFTTYVYRVTVFNILGQSTSPNSSLVTTFGGLPRLPANISATALDYMSILVNWTIPNPVDLQGQVQNLSLQAQSNISTMTYYPDIASTSYTMTSLQPNTQYSVTLTVTVYGGAIITSQPALATTKDGAPSGLNPPQLFIVSQTALRVSWTAPSQPNGDIVAYRILVNDRTIDTGLRVPGSTVVTGLQPYTVYDVRIQACTISACSVSNSVFGTTAEALPQGITAPVVNSAAPTQVIATWSPPNLPNGIIQRYELWRKTLQNCADIPTPTVNPVLQKCTYIECGILENLCGTTCYSGAKVCCSGVIYNAVANFVCCGTQYLLQPGPNYVCCSGQFYEPRMGFQCCGQRYVEAQAGEICCPDSIENRVSISQGDTCCGSVPFLSSGAQICCKGSLTNKRGNKCCGGAVISDTITCCGDANNGQIYLQQLGYTCCGQDYVKASTSVCCAISTGSARAHLYGSEQEKLTASDKCCGLNLITKNLACCNIVGYNQLSQSCADRSSQDFGCGTGVVCPLSQQNTAFCNRCDFDTTQRTCHSVKGSQNLPTPTPDPTAICTTKTERVYFGLNLNYTDSTLAPYSQYEYSVTVVNSAGSVSSTYTAVRTLEAVPELVHPPSARIAPEQLYAFYLTWNPPEKPNGIITSYILKRDGIELYNGPDTNFTDDSNILPYQSYSYMLSACNSVGCGNSNLVTVATAQSVPEDLLPPLVQVLNSTAISFIAQPPGQANGVILTYSVAILDLGDSYNSTLPQQFVVTDLTPFTSYTLETVVCTVVGCSTSPNISVTTMQDLPKGISAPEIIVINSTSIELHWLVPDLPNGIITSFTIIQTRPTPVTVVYNGKDLVLRLSSLSPGQTYTYQLQVTNGAGSNFSEPRDIIMPTQTPLNVPTPQATALSSTSVLVQWQPMSLSQGDIDQYQVLLNIGLESEVIRGVGLQTRVTIPDLLKYTKYEVRLQACLRNVLNGCGTSSATYVTTLEDKPQEMMAPLLTAFGPDAVDITWRPPQQPNGIITRYRIYQRVPNVSISEILINQVPASMQEFLHSGQDLKPYQVYEYRVVAENSKGETSSNWTSVRTLEAPPTGFSAPVISNISTYGISLLWLPPTNPNGIIQEYRIVFQLSTSTTQSVVSVAGNVFNTSLSGLQAYSSYVLYVEAINGAGSVASPSVTFTTREGYPAGMPDFNIERVNTGTSVILTWNPPLQPNGIITTYRVYQAGYGVPIYSDIARNFEFRRLSPYTEYFVSLEACTRAGCTLGKVQAFYTAEIAPTSQSSPTIGTVNATQVQLSWQPPLSPNGVILSYEVLRASSTPVRKRDVSSVIQHFSFSDMSLPSVSVMNSSQHCPVHHLQCQTEGQFGHLVYHISDINYTPEIFLTQTGKTNLQLNLIDQPNLHRSRRQASTPTNPQTVYKTTDTAHDTFNYTDTGLSPYTNYQYSIRASNSLGSTSSPWMAVQTQQAAPDGVKSPLLSYVANDIGSINIAWSLPLQMNGVLQGFQLQRNLSVPFSFRPDDAMNFVDSGLSAYTTYSYTLTACTAGGCSTSQPAAITTLEAAPLLVSPPVVLALNSTALIITWSKPQISNGVITQYKLKVDGQFIFIGLQESLTLPNLLPYKSYVFTLTACTHGGCTESAEVTGRTDDAPPTGLSPPLLRVLGSRSIEITWSPPANPNGVISSYDVRRDGRLIYTSSISSGGLLPTSYTDYSLMPGMEYEYTIIARNRKGTVESLPQKAVTYSTSPAGLPAPNLTPVNSTSIKVDWSPPATPNGALTNYSVFEGNNRVYSCPPSQMTYTVPGLQPFSQYTFSIEACTDRGCAGSQSAQAWTLSASPEQQPAPSLLALANDQGAHLGVKASWDPPAKTNGNITTYELFRRDVISGLLLNYGQPVLVYNNSGRVYIDNSSQLQPYHQYQYMVVAVNIAGQVGSSWADVTTREAAPREVLPPVVNSRTATTINVTIQPADSQNGKVKLYQILINNTSGQEQFASPGPVVVGTLSPLTPFTTYELQTQACTSVGCTTSAGILAVTDSAKPTGLAAITVVNKTSSMVNLAWTPPARPNGNITRYEVYQRSACPPTNQLFQQNCTIGDPSLIYSGPNLAFSVANLNSYRAYEFQLKVFNDKGGSDFPDWVRAETDKSAPVYSSQPSLYKNGTQAMISWGTSFTLNGQLRYYELRADGNVVFQGITSVAGVERATKDQIISFIIKAVTDSGEAESPKIIFDPNSVNNVGTTQAPPVAVAAASTPFYQEVWFIVLMCIIALLIIFILLVIFIRCSNSRHPYVRERKPLHGTRQGRQSRDIPVLDSSNVSVTHRNGLISRKTRNRDIYQGPGIGVINPAFSQDGELARLPSTKINWPSAKYIDDDDDEDDLKWGRHLDSGLFDDLDDDSNSGQTYSYTKEQTVFTDTHL